MAMNGVKHIFHLGDVVDVKVLQEILDCFCAATGLAAMIVDYQGKPISRYSNFHKFCSKVRSHPIAGIGCEKSDAYGGIIAVRTGQPFIYRCHMGLIDLSAPIIVDGQYLGAVMTGQVTLENEAPELERIATPAIDINEDSELMELYKLIPSMSKDVFEAAGRLIFIIANYIAEKGIINIYQNKLNEQNILLMQEIKAKNDLENALSTAELQAIHSQISPHFLFNTLNSISRQAILEDAPKTQEMVYAMAELLRASAGRIGQKVTIRDELNYIKHYLLIEETRLHDRIRVEFDVDETCLDNEIPIFTLQPLLENALIHGLEPKEEGGIVHVVVKRDNSKILLEVSDNGIGITSDTLAKIRKLQAKSSGDNNLAGIGISIAVKRLKYIFKEDFDWDIISQPNKGTKISLFIPDITKGWDLNG